MDYKQMTNEQLAKHIAALYDSKGDYKAAYAELVRRVGQDEAERLVEAA